MDYHPIVAYVIMLGLYRLSEGTVMVMVGSWKKMPKGEWTLPLVVVSFVLILIGPICEYLYCGTRPGLIAYAMGGLFFLLSIVFRIKGHLDLKKGFSMAVEKIEGQHLVDSGLYRYIRHPLYLGTLFLFVACPTFLGAHFSWALSLLGFLAIYIRIRKEESFLVKHMPGYREYMNRTYALIPRIY